MHSSLHGLPAAMSGRAGLRGLKAAGCPMIRFTEIDRAVKC